MSLVDDPDVVFMRTPATELDGFPPFGYSLNSDSSLLHRPRTVEAIWTRGRMRAAWQCGGSAGSAAFTTRPEGREHCTRCDMSFEQTTNTVVYMGRTPEGDLKIGSTGNYPYRAAVQGLTDTECCPGSYSEEWELHALMGRPIHGNEVFEATANRLDVARAWMAKRRAAAS